MIGAGAGNRVLFIGRDHPALAAEIARATGLNGQTLVVTSGCGWVQREGGPVEEICAGDVATIAPREAHWHGATATSAMTHVALSESGGVEWLDQVTDAEYTRGSR